MFLEFLVILAYKGGAAALHQAAAARPSPPDREATMTDHLLPHAARPAKGVHYG